MCVCSFSALSRRIGALQITCTAEMPASADSKNICVANSSLIIYMTFMVGLRSVSGVYNYPDYTYLRPLWLDWRSISDVYFLT